MLPGLASVMMSGPTGGVAPSAVNWANISGEDSGANAAQIISGISESILLHAEISGLSTTGGGAGDLYILVDSGGGGSEPAANGGAFDFPVDPGSSVYFSASGASNFSWSLGFTVTIKFMSAGSPTFDQTLDTFTVALTGDGFFE